MFTIKLRGRSIHSDPGVIPVHVQFKTRVVEAVEVEIHHLRLDELVEIEGDNAQGHFAFYVANPTKPRPDGFANELFFWDEAFIENANGKTTESIRWF